MERLIIDGKVTLVDDEGNSLKKVDSSSDYDSEDEVASGDSDMANFLASEKIDKMERLIIDGKVTLVDDEGNSLKNVDSSGDYDSEDEVASGDSDMANFLASEKKDGVQNSLIVEDGIWSSSKALNETYDGLGLS
ncbi:hypothetical protein Tco_1051873 [Tanacetum coccineum]